MKKSFCILLAFVLFASAITGCSSRSGNLFEADNEIFTYDPIDPEKTQIVVSRTGNIEVKKFCEDFEAKNPDVQVVYLDITGGNTNYQPLVEWVTRGYSPDIVFSGAAFFDERLTQDYFQNLSTSPIIQSYEAEALKRTAVNDDVYWLPGPSNISAMMYNKTLFAEYGWEVPATFDEFVSLCDQIREDTGGAVEPWNPNAKYSQELLTAIEAFTYEELFGGVENRSWYNDLTSGKEASLEHMQPYFEVLQTLVDHGILREEHFSYSATSRGKEFSAGSIAMINANIYDADTDEFDFSYMPFPTTKGELGYMCGSYSCFVGLPVKEQTDEKMDVIDRFLNFFSSSEGQISYIGSTMKVSNVKDVPLNQSNDLTALQPAISAGHIFQILDFSGISDTQCNFNLHQIAMDIATGAKTANNCILDIRSGYISAADVEAPPAPEVIALADKDMTILETSFYFADMYREKMNADIGLITNNEPFRGNMMRIFEGEITPDIVTVLKPRSFANESTLVKISMTGKQIMNALNAPVGNDNTANCIYAYSGLKCKVAPGRALGEKYLSVKLENGGILEEDKLYTVAVWSGTVAEVYYTEILESCEGTWEELMTAKLAAEGNIAPANDGRIQLVWD